MNAHAKRFGFLVIAMLLCAGAMVHAAEVETLKPAKAVPANLPFAEAVRVGDTVYLSGQIGVMPGTTKLVPGGIREEARQTMDNIRATLTANGLGMENVVKCTIMLADLANDYVAFNEVYRTYFSGRYPARSAFGSNGLAFGAKVEVECIAADRK